MSGYGKACAIRPPWVMGRCEHKIGGMTCGKCPHFAPEPLTEQALEMHIRGSITMGSYQLSLDNTVKWLCLDFDDKGEVKPEELQDAVRIARLSLEDLRIPTSVEASGGNGWRAHVWSFFSSPIPAIKARVILDAALRQCGLHEKTYIERFPKQSRALNGYGNLVKIPFGVNRKTGRRSLFLDDDFDPIESIRGGLDTIQLIDPLVVDYVIDMRHLDVQDSAITVGTPAKNFDHPPEVMNRILSKCAYFREVERQQMDEKCKVHYEDWLNYVTMFCRFGKDGVDRIMRLSALDERFDADRTINLINYMRQHGYHAPSCRRLKSGPGQICCPLDPLECGAA